MLQYSQGCDIIDEKTTLLQPRDDVSRLSANTKTVKYMQKTQDIQEKQAICEMRAIELPDYVKTVIELLDDAGYEAYAVGGCVRDSLRNVEPHDWDICTSALPEQITEVLSGVAKIIPTGINHGTVTVLLRKAWHPMEVTTFRTESEYDDCRHPNHIEFVSAVAEDLKRRDFTVNAMAYNDKSGVIDLFGGREDLLLGIIRCVGNAEERFSEDALRIMRAMRFAAVCGFKIEPDTAAAMHKKCGLLKNISAERIYSEFKKMLCGESAAEIMTVHREVLSEIIPESFSHENFNEKNLSMLKFFSSDKEEVAFKIAAVLLPVEDSNVIMRRLKSERVTRLRVKTLTELFGGDASMTAPTEKPDVLRLLRDYGKETTEDILTFGRGYALSRGETAEDWNRAAEIVDETENDGSCYNIGSLAVCGKDLKRLGYRGDRIGERLEVLLDAVISGKVNNTKRQLLKYKG